VSLTNVCFKYNEYFPEPSPWVRTLNIVATKDTNSHSTIRGVQSTVESKRMGRISSLKSFKRTEDKSTGKLQRSLKEFRIHEALRPNQGR
jgi:hypothetical protein